MILSLVSQFIQTFGATGLLSLFLILHLVVGFILPYRCGFKPPLFVLAEIVGRDLERRLNRETRRQSSRFFRGIFVVLLMGVFCYLLNRLVHFASALSYGWVAELVFLSLCINFMMPLKLVRQVMRDLRGNDLPKVAAALQPYVEEPLDKADSHTLIRKTVEFVVVSLNRFLVGPAFWFLLAGAGGLSVYIVYAGLREAFGLPDERRKYFGRCVRIVDNALNIIPAFVTAIVLCVSSLFVSKSNPLRAIVTLLHQKKFGAYLGLPMAAMAGGLGVTLGGPVRYTQNYVEERTWIGPEGSSARLTVEDLGRAAMLQYVFFVCIMGLQSLLMIMGI